MWRGSGRAGAPCAAAQRPPAAHALHTLPCLSLGWELKSITPLPSGAGYALAYSTPNGDQTLRARTVALTVPSYVAAGLVRGAAPAATRSSCC